MSESTLTIRELPEGDRPREKLQLRGPDALSDAELIAILLRVGIPGKNAVQLAQEMLKDFGSLAEVARQDYKTLCRRKGVGPAKAVQLQAAFGLASRVAREQVLNVPLNSPDKIYAMLGLEMSMLPRESMRVILVNTRLSCLRIVEIGDGSLASVSFDCRDILRPVLLHEAYGFILVHNHPSGDPTPSSADLQATRRIRDAAGVIGVEFLDHVILGRPAEGRAPFYSFRQVGVLG